MWFETRQPKKKTKRGRGGGGGGKVKIALGRTGPRGKLYAPPPKGTTVVVKTKFVRAGKGGRSAIRQHLKYIQERERGENEPPREFFDREKEGIERKDVYDAMIEGQGRRAAMHTLILSPGDNEVDLQDYTRESLKALEERLGYELDWYGTTHENTDHHHSHVVIAGKIPNREDQYERQVQQPPGRSQRLSGRWRNEEQQLREVMGHWYDEEPLMDPREERRQESKLGSGSEREPTDPRVKELIGEGARTVEEINTERMIERLERSLAARAAANQRGEVYLDRADLKELRDAGNDYLARERSLEREVDRAFEREMERDIFSPERHREREHTLDSREDSREDTRTTRGGRSDRGDRDDEDDRQVRRGMGRGE